MNSGQSSPVRAVITVLALAICSCASNELLLSNAGYILHTGDGKISSLRSINEHNIFMQRHDYSCGAASLATLMHFYFDDDVSEQSILKQMDSLFNEQQMAIIAERGLSFRELAEISQARGYQSASVRLKPEVLAQLKGPILVYVSTSDYKHFAVLRGMLGEYVYLADPSRGNIRLTLAEFVNEWGGESFVLGKPGFGTPADQGLSIVDRPALLHQETLLRSHTHRPAIGPRAMWRNGVEL